MNHENSQSAGHISFVVVVPAFNHASTICDVLAGIQRLGFPVIVVNDGCTDDTAKRLAAWCSAHPCDSVHVITHQTNRGKAAAMRSAFAEAARRNHTHAITIDADGQHDPNDIPALLDVVRKNPSALVLGERSDRLPNTPRGSLLGRRLTNLLITATCGLTPNDSQCGLRAYPLALIQSVPCRAGRYAFESEIITRATWAGWPVLGVPVTSWYPPPEQRVSHFRPFLDTLHGILLQARLVARAILPWPHRRTCAATSVKSSEPDGGFVAWVRRATPSAIWEQARQGVATQASLAGALAVGTFIANLPIYPLQTAAAIYIARRLHLQPLPVVAGSLLSTPPLGPLLIALGIGTGHLLLHGQVVDISQFDLATLPGLLELMRQLLLEWIVGSVVVGTAIMVATFFITWAALARWSCNLAPSIVPGVPRKPQDDAP